MPILTVDANVWVSAFDATDALHISARKFLMQTQSKMLELVAPSFVVLETGCALSRRLQSAEQGRLAAERLTLFPLLRLELVDARLEREALLLGTKLRLRGADALYAALAQRTGGPLITMDLELHRRTQGQFVALTPDEWLLQQPS